MMDSRHLETLIWVVRLGGIGAAAQHLNLTQPAITRRIQELERELGAKVLRRQGRNVVPTSLGHLCIGNAERILLEMATMRVAASGTSAIGTIRMGIVESIALTWMESLLSRIKDYYPKIQVAIDVDLSSRLAIKLSRRQIDIALLPGPIQIAGIVKVALGSCPMNWLGSSNLNADDREMTAADLVAYPIISMPQDANAYYSTLNYFKEADVTPGLVHHCNSFSAMASLVRSGMGISLLPPDLFANDLEAGRLKILINESKLLTVDYSAAYIPGVDVTILPEIAALAREESWFLGSLRRKVRTYPF